MEEYKLDSETTIQKNKRYQFDSKGLKYEGTFDRVHGKNIVFKNAAVYKRTGWAIEYILYRVGEIEVLQKSICDLVELD